MVKTRSAVQKEQHECNQEDNPIPVEGAAPSEHVSTNVSGSEPFLELRSSNKTNSRKSSCSSSRTIRLQLEKKAAEEKARIELKIIEEKARIEKELIEKRLAADLAEINYSPRSSRCTNSEVNDWIDRSQREINVQAAHDYGTYRANLCQSRVGVNSPAPGTDGLYHNTALNDPVTSAAVTDMNTNLLSRLSISKELPWFSGDPMEWLEFKLAYEESTAICKFSPIENMWRLRKCLRGAAKEAVAALLITCASPEEVMSTLQLQFGNSDLILSRIQWEINKLHPLPHEYHRNIVAFSIKIKNYVAAVCSLGRNEYLHDINITRNILSKMPTVLLSKWTDYGFNENSIQPKLVKLSEFLNAEAVKISRSNINLVNFRHEPYKRRQDNSINLVQSSLLERAQSDNENCKYCRTLKHTLPNCKKFKRSLRKDRWTFVKRQGICFKCLIDRHDRNTCRAPMCDINNCGQSHHRLLHYNIPSNNIISNESVLSNEQVRDEPSSTATQLETVTNLNVSSFKVLLKVVPIVVHGPKGKIHTTALLDDGSTVTLIKSSLAEMVGATGQKEMLHVRGAWDNSEIVYESQVIKIKVTNRDNNVFNINARSVDRLNLPCQDFSTVDCNSFSHLQNLKHYFIYDQCQPEILIGQDNNHLLLPLDVVMGKPNEPIATRTPLGWCVHGRLARFPGQVRHSSLLISCCSEENKILQELHKEVKDFFSFESMGVNGKPRQNSDDLRAINCLERTAVLREGRWWVGLPWKNDESLMPDSRSHALYRLRSVERKMKSDSGYALRYTERIDHLLKNDFAKEVFNVNMSPKTWYLPHFGVDNPNKKKLRLVFDAAAAPNGTSLNDYLLKGPDLLISLFGVMLRFRENPIAVTGDIKDMFLRIKIRPEDQDALRFLWRYNSEHPVKTYAMTSLIFGANCSPFVAQYIKNKNAQLFEQTMPNAVEAIIKQHYMDDYIDSLPNEQIAIELIKEISFVYKQGGFHICNWNSSSKTVISTIPEEDLATASVKFKFNQQSTVSRTLGLIWEPQDDTLRFDLTFKNIPKQIIDGSQRPTKRNVLCVVMSIYDVYGFLSPFTLKGKLILQETWSANLKWNDVLNDELYVKWCVWISQLPYISQVRLHRYYYKCDMREENIKINESPPTSGLPRVVNDYNNLQLHIFSDASTKAMCAVAYLRWTNEKIRVAFVAAKCRVAPVKHVSVPRLELQAALLAARLADTLIKEHRISVQRRFFWCDSKTVLHWICNDARNYKVFVAHRLGEIDELTRAEEWHYVPTRMNVADVGTRETDDCSVLQNEWLNGPSFLYEDETSWPRDLPDLPETETYKLEFTNIIQVNHIDLPVPDVLRFSSWSRLLKTTYTVLKFINKCKKLTNVDEADVIDQAQCLLIRQAQQQSFANELLAVTNNKCVDRKSKLLTLTPFLDEHGVLRVSGRVDAAVGISAEIKKPVILDGRHHLSKLIIMYYHKRFAHGSQETVVNEIKQKYWIIRLRPTIKNVVAKCMFCRIRKASPIMPRMGDLPEARVAHSQRPFTFCGVDLFGPIDVAVGRRREKRYGVLFTCLTVRAIHIEIVGTLTSDSMIMALRRMAARRGWPRHLYSDNGTNLRGADVELKKSIQDLDQTALNTEALNYGTTWTFIPPASPHWGGAWERLIRSVKTALKVTLKERVPRDEVLSTLMAEVECMVNSRPLTHVSVEPGSAESLTPNHFLLGTTSNLPTIGKFDREDLSLRKQWRISQGLAEMFWKRWVREVLPTLLPRQKWNREGRSIRPGDLVLVLDPNIPRNMWLRGIVQSVFPGQDGRVRMIDVKLKSGNVLRRSVARVVPIPVDDECW